MVYFPNTSNLSTGRNTSARYQPYQPRQQNRSQPRYHDIGLIGIPTHGPVLQMSTLVTNTIPGVSARSWDQYDIGGSSVKAYIGPEFRRGTSTDHRSLPKLMKELHKSDANAGTDAKGWIAGHLLNEELGGSGIDSKNLTPLTSAANRSHATFEGYIKKMLNLSRQADPYLSNEQFFCGIEYHVTVSPTRFAYAPNPSDLFSYVTSHITISYRYAKFKRDISDQAFMGHLTSSDVNGSRAFSILKNVNHSSFSGNSHIKNHRVFPDNFGAAVEIHNT